ncbi:MAG: CPBP family intramembrane metalloprotease [Clostridia bacterium]|nr:CPBP family intramembrane metalloprotease [Clostridia bacterium]
MEEIYVDPMQEWERAAKRAYSMVGFALLIFIAAAYGVQFVASFLVEWLFPAVLETKWYIWALSVLPLYLVGLPLSLIFFLQVRAGKPVGGLLSPAGYAGTFPVTILLMYAGSYVATFILNILSTFRGEALGGEVSQMIMENSSTIWAFLATVVVAPVMEEFITRKMVMDRLAPYGVWPAAIFSGVAFGMIHGNLEQFFYAFFLGTFFALIYAKSGRILYTMLLHAAVNFMGSVVAPAVISGIDLAVLETDDPMVILEYMAGGGFRSLVPLLAYTGVMLGLAGTGVVLLLAFGKKFLPKRGNEKTGRYFANPGVIAFLACTLILMLIATFF